MIGMSGDSRWEISAKARSTKASEIDHRCMEGSPSKCSTASDTLPTMPSWAHRLDRHFRVPTTSNKRQLTIIATAPYSHSRDQCAGRMTDLSRLVEASTCSSLPYIYPAFPNRPLVLHSARPRDYDVGTPVLFVHHGVSRNGRDYRGYRTDLVDRPAWRSPLSSPKRRFRTSLVSFWQSARRGAVTALPSSRSWAATSA
jgi:hypothetical protein